MNAFDYFPILRWKEGERKALKRFASAFGSSTLPIIETVAGSNHWRDIAREFYGTHIGAIAIDQRYGDVGLTEPESEMDIRVIPVSGKANASPGHALRLPPDKWDSIIGRPTRDVPFVVFDAGSREPGDYSALRRSVSSIAQEAVAEGFVAPLAFAYSSFPDSLTELDHDEVHELPRPEFPGRLSGLVYSDYGIGSAEPPKPPVKGAIPHPNIRYTADDRFLVMRAHEEEQIQSVMAVCQALVAHPAFEGVTGGWADEWIIERSEGRGGPGGPPAWREVGTFRHLSRTVRSLANRPGP